jgi:hypothetical protein
MVDPVVARAHAAIVAREWPTVRLTLHPYLHWTGPDGVTLRGRRNILALLERIDPPESPAWVELRDGQIYRWRA